MIRTRSRKPRGEGDAPITHEEASLLAAVPVRSGGQEVRIGAFVIAGVIAVVVALFLLTDPSFFRGRYEVTTRVADAGGLRRGDPVQMRGVNVGRIRGFGILQDGVEVMMEMEGEYPVPADSRVVLRSAGLLGGMIAEIIPGRSREELRGGASLPGRSEEGLTGLTETATGLSVEADTVLRRVQALLAPQTIGAVGASAGELQQLLTELSALAVEQRRDLAVVSASLRRSAAGVEGATTGPELERTVARVDSLTARLNETTGRLDRASGSLETVLARVERGDGTLGRLSRDDSLYVNMNEAARRVNELVADIQANPRRYINLRVF
ncbi:MAG: MlaD family protein [Gemmatimonadota bacterium]|nr:MlaD family protein [Gemmatimonadota bacterium]